MIQDTLSQVKKRIETADSIKDEKKKELMGLLSVLQNEIEQLAKTNPEHAESIVGFAQTSAHEAMRQQKRTDLHRLSLEGLAGTVEGIETSHPELVRIVNSICNALANLGI
jgi:hypothetical protein